MWITCFVGEAVHVTFVGAGLVDVTMHEVGSHAWTSPQLHSGIRFVVVVVVLILVLVVFSTTNTTSTTRTTRTTSITCTNWGGGLG